MSGESKQSASAQARSIWQSGVAAVDSQRLVRQAIHREGDRLTICGRRFQLSALRRIAVVGAGKAGAGMAAAVEDALGERAVREQLVGWVNVPADCVQPLRKIHVHAGRPAAVNEPTAEGVAGTQQIIQIVSALTKDDLCLVLISGGGSALMPAPRPPLTLEDKQDVTRFLMAHGATIQELNTVRKRLSRIKGGGLGRMSRAGATVGLIISDVVGNPLDVIASGPTHPDTATDAAAVAILRRFGAVPPRINPRVLACLQDAGNEQEPAPAVFGTVENHIIGSNTTAVTAADRHATALGYEVISLGSDHAGDADEEGVALAARCLNTRATRRANDRPVCILSGGEPTVRLAETNRPRKGGRNQQLVLAGLNSLLGDGMRGLVLLSGGTDGEDGPTDAAGAWADQEVIDAARAKHLDPAAFLAINDAYTFFAAAGGLLKTGPTHTNVMDLRVALVGDDGR